MAKLVEQKNSKIMPVTCSKCPWHFLNFAKNARDTTCEIFWKMFIKPVTLPIAILKKNFVHFFCPIHFFKKTQNMPVTRKSARDNSQRLEMLRAKNCLEKKKHLWGPNFIYPSWGNIYRLQKATSSIGLFRPAKFFTMMNGRTYGRTGMVWFISDFLKVTQ